MMKKIILLAVSLLSIASLSAQSNVENATKTVAMTNSVIDLYNSYLPYLKKAREGLDAAKKNKEALSENINAKVKLWSCEGIAVQNEYRTRFEEAADTAAAFPEKTSIWAGVKFIVNKTNELSEHCYALNTYFNKKEYRQDRGWRKYNQLYGNLEDAYREILNMWSITIRFTTEAADRSELELLRRSPLATFIVPMKTDLSAAGRILGRFAEEEVDHAALQKDIEALRRSCRKNKSLFGKNTADLDKYSSKDLYQKFYEAMNDFVEIAGRIENLTNPENTTEEKTRNQLTQSLFSMINEKYNLLVECYNAM